jgi:hypothetical protein
MRVFNWLFFILIKPFMLNNKYFVYLYLFFVGYEYYKYIFDHKVVSN